MPLTPDDIVNYPLKQSMRGYSIPQVDELLDQVADELERLRRALDDAYRRLEQAERKAETLDETESTLRRTLVTAQRAAEETVEEARRRADELLEEARGEAETERERALEGARQREGELRDRHERLRATIEELEEFESTYRDNLREMLRQHLELLDGADPRPEGDRPEMVTPEPPPGPDRPEDDDDDDVDPDEAPQAPPSDRPGERRDVGSSDPAVDEEIFGRSGRGSGE